MNPHALIQLVKDNPGKTAAEIVALYPDAVRVPRETQVTYTTLASAAVWGRDRAKAVMATLRMAAGGDSPLAADAQQAVDLLTGTGFDPQDPESVDAIALFVTNRVITQPEADAVQFLNADDTCTEQQAQAAIDQIAKEVVADAFTARLGRYSVALSNARADFERGTRGDLPGDAEIAQLWEASAQ